MSKILITGATGNVGSETIQALAHSNHTVIAAVSSAKHLQQFTAGSAVLLDFTDTSMWKAALDGVQKVFLLRPPAISDVKRYLFPFIDAALDNHIEQVVFLSLQGVQFNPLTPHYKVERYLRKRKAPYTLLRPNFFMQNLSTFYKDDIIERNEIFLPAGKGRTAFIDVRDIGTVAAKVLTAPGHIGKAYTLSGIESLDYYQVAGILTDVLNREIIYKNPTVSDYVARLKSQEADEDFIKVQKMLYFVVRHNFSASTSSALQNLLGHAPISFKQFAQDNASVWSK